MWLDAARGKFTGRIIAGKDLMEVCERRAFLL